jgi:hypothetical protein
MIFDPEDDAWTSFMFGCQHESKLECPGTYALLSLLRRLGLKHTNMNVWPLRRTAGLAVVSPQHNPIIKVI